MQIKKTLGRCGSSPIKYKYVQAAPMEGRMGCLHREPISQHKKNPFHRMGVSMNPHSPSSDADLPVPREKLIRTENREFKNYKALSITQVDEILSPGMSEGSQSSPLLNFMDLRTPPPIRSKESSIKMKNTTFTDLVLPFHIPEDNSLLLRRKFSIPVSPTRFTPTQSPDLPPEETKKGIRHKMKILTRRNSHESPSKSLFFPTKEFENEENIDNEENLNTKEENPTPKPQKLPTYRETLNLSKLKREIRATLKYKERAELANIRPSIHLPQPKRCISTSKSIIFDLDETLVVCSQKPFNKSIYDEKDVFYSPKLRVHILFRPFARTMLQKLRADFELIIYTAGDQIYIDEVMKILDPHSQLIDHYLSRAHCSKDKERYYKDLSLINNRSAKDIIVVDDDIFYWPRDLHNFVPVAPYYGQENDTHLINLYLYLQTFILAQNSVEHNIRWLRLADLMKY